MSEYSKEVREEAARRANAAHLDDPDWTADNIANDWIGRALCRAVADGLLHLDPVELNRARWEEAKRRFASQQGLTVDHFYRRLVREGWQPKPVDPVAEVAREVAKQYKNHPDPRVEADAIATFAIRAWIERSE